MPVFENGGVPSLSFEPIANLGKTYRDARNERTLADLGKGLADGSLDYKQAAGKAAEAGRLDLGMSLLKLGQEKEAGEQFNLSLGDMFGSQPAAPQAQAQAQPAPTSRSQSGPPPGGRPMLPGAATDGINVPPRPQIAGNSRIVGDNEPGNPYGSPPASPSAQPQQVAQAPQPQAPQAPPNMASFGNNPSAQLRLRALAGAVGNSGLPQASRDVAKILFEHASKSSDPTPDQKEYIGAVQQGETDNYTQWYRKNKQAASQSITIDQRLENEEAKAYGAGVGKRAVATVEAAGAAPVKIQNLNRMGAMLSQIESGKIAPAQYNISAWAKSLGLPDGVSEKIGLDPKKAGTAQAIAALTNELTLGHIGPGGLPANNFSNADREFIVEIAPSLGNDPEANRIKIEASKRLASLDIEKGREWNKFRASQRGLLADKRKGFDDFEIDWAEKTADRDLFGDLIPKAKALVKTGVGAPSAPGAASADGWRDLGNGVRIREKR